MRPLLLACLLLCVAPGVQAQKPNPIVGNWKLNLEKSQFPTKQRPQLEVRTKA